MSKLDLALVPLLNPDGRTITHQWLLYLLGQNTDVNANTTDISTLSADLTALQDEVESTPTSPSIPIITALATRVAALEMAPPVSQGASGMRIKSIQRGLITLSGVATNTATVTSVDTNKSILWDLGTLASGGLTTFEDTNIYLELTNATTITATRAGTAGAPIVSYQLVEYIQ